MTRVPELLAPAGSIEMLHASVRAGADAVYLGMGELNARCNAQNFDEASLAEALDYCHARSVRTYVTMNTLVLQDEMDSALRLASACLGMGADGLIIQDIGFFRRLREAHPDADLHVSTQMSVHSRYGVAGCAAMGADRVTFARELSMEELRSLTETAHGLSMEVEAFVHGALCVCYSGHCLMSSLIGSRSANRGLCAQPCRLPYRLVDAEGNASRMPGEHLLSPKDLCAFERLDDLVGCGIDSLKVEGRMKSPEYAHAVVSVYREALDRIASDPDGGSQTAPRDDALSSSDDGRTFMRDAKQRLGSVFSRGFTTAYLDGDRSDAMMSYTRPNNRGESLGRVKSADGRILRFSSDRPVAVGDMIEAWTSRGNVTFEVGEGFEQRKGLVTLPLPDGASIVHKGDRVFRVRSVENAYSDDPMEPRIPVKGYVELRIGSPLHMRFETPVGDADGTQDPIALIAYEAEGPIVEAARTKEVTEDEVAEHVDRLGRTHFRLEELDISLDTGVGIGFSQLHRTRTEALDGLLAVMLSRYGEAARARAASRRRARTEAGSILSDAGSPAGVSTGSGARTSSTRYPLVAVKATNPECARVAKRAGADLVYVPALAFKRGQSLIEGRLSEGASRAAYPKDSILIMPAIEHDAVGKSREAMLGMDAWQNVHPGDRVMADGLGPLVHALAAGAVPESGPSLPIVNDDAIAEAARLGADTVWFGPEPNMGQLRGLAKSAAHQGIRTGITVFGAQELMVTEHCALMGMGKCDEDCPSCRRRRTSFSLEDRKGYCFPVVNDAVGRSHIHNSVELDAVPFVPELVEMGVGILMVDATLLSAERTAQMVGRLRKAVDMALAGEGALPKEPHTTTGHLHRGVR